MADLTPVYDALRQAQASGDTANAKKLADYIAGQTKPTYSNTTVKADPTDGMSTFDKIAAGAGKGAVDLARGVGQALGLESRADVAEARRLDAPLMATKAGKSGDILGTIGALAPSMLIPGANRLAPAAMIGASTGALAPSTSTGETVANTLLGAAGGPAGLLAGRTVGAVAQGAKAAFIDPFTKSGQQGIAARAMQSFAGSPEKAAEAAQRLSSPPQVLPGVQPTTAELANNAGLAQLERSLRNNPQYLTMLTDHNQGNRAAMTSAVNNIAGTDVERRAADDVRSRVTQSMYRAADNVMVPSDDKLEAIMRRPSMEQAWARAKKLAAERGTTLVTPADPSPLAGAAGAAFDNAAPQYSGKAIQYLKMGLNDLANSGPQNGMGAHELGAVRSTLSALNDWTAQNVPKLRGADNVYAALSEPINQMDVGQQLSNKLTPALADFGNNTRLSAANFANALRNGDQLAAKTTGWKGATLDSVLNPDQLTTLRQVGEQLARRSNADELGRAVGSNTGQNLVAQNVLSQFLGPFGLPQSTIGRVGANALSKAIGKLGSNTLYAGAEPDVMGLLAKAAVDPKLAAGLLRAGLKAPKPNRYLPSQSALLPFSVGGGLLANPSQQ